jgi:ribonuclease G
MTKTVLINVGAGEIRVAVLENGVLDQLWLERTFATDPDRGRRHSTSGLNGGRSVMGDIILGRVQRVIPAMQAAFVEIGLERAGFLAAREARPRTAIFRDEPYTDEDRQLRIADFVREGEDILVQVVKDPIAEKGARLSANVTLAGRLLILAPNSPGIALSRRIEDEAERARLTAIVQEFAHGSDEIIPGAGYILRTAAMGGSASELREDAARLSRVWREIEGRRATAQSPAILFSDIGPIDRALRDEVDGTVDKVLIDDSDAVAEARAYAERAMPALLGRVELYHSREPLFEAFGIEDEIAQLIEPRVALPSGGWITIEATEALTAIDVNSGSYIEGSGLEETSLKVNLEAAEMIGRQLRLRGIGGLIVIDFIHLEQPANIDRLLEALHAACGKGRIPSQILRMSEFGLVEMTRKRVRDPLVARVTETCRRCDGHGRRKTVETVAVDMMRQIERAHAAAPDKSIVLKASPVMVRWLDAHDEDFRAALRKRAIIRVRIEHGADTRREHFSVETV